MMWLMYRPASSQQSDTPATDPARFSDRELAVLTELLQARSTEQKQTPPPVETPILKERAA